MTLPSPPPEGSLLDWWFGRQRLGMGPGLDRVRALLADMGDPHTAFDAVLVGGTNGKGSVTALLAALLGSEGPSARFVSPHLVDVRERFVIDGRPVEAALLHEALVALRPAAERSGATFFEIATALACKLFADAGVQRAVFEVGVGGTWDCTNALEPVLSAITHVALDHVGVLGGDVETIARDKAGILRAGRPAVTGARGAARTALEEEAERRGASLWRVGFEIDVTSHARGWDGSDVVVETPLGRVETRTALVGPHQARNAAVAIAAAQRLGVDAERIARIVPTVTWPGRLEVLRVANRRVVLDGAHNPDAAEALASSLRALGAAPVGLVLGLSANKDAEGVVRALAPVAAWTIVTRAARSRRGRPAAELLDVVTAVAPAAEVALVDTPDAALDAALDRTEEGGLVLVAGSLFLVGEVRARLVGAEPEPWLRDQ